MPNAQNSFPSNLDLAGKEAVRMDRKMDGNPLKVKLSDAFVVVYYADLYLCLFQYSTIKRN